MKKPKLTLKQLKGMEEEIMKMAEQRGVDQNYFFVTAFNRYKAQISILNNLETALSKDGVLVTKEYVKGRENIYCHPAVGDFNRTTDSANKTMLAIMKLLDTIGAPQERDLDPFEAF
jgi:hypothetical protein